MPYVSELAAVRWFRRSDHDRQTKLFHARGATAAHFKRAVYERLKPGGSYVIVDHAAAVGAGTSDAQSLHRIEPAFAREAGEAGGFLLDEESTILANKDGPHPINGLATSVQGEDDRLG